MTLFNIRVYTKQAGLYPAIRFSTGEAPSQREGNHKGGPY